MSTPEEERKLCMCGHRARSHGPNWHGESPEKEPTGFPVCHYPGCKCMAYCEVEVGSRAVRSSTVTRTNRMAKQVIEVCLRNASRKVRMSAAKQFALEPMQLLFTEAGILTKRSKDGDLLVQCTDATFECLTGDRAAYLAPLLCTCPQREHPHELSIHALIRHEWWKKELRTLWPWSLMASVREEPSTERKHDAA